MKELLRRIYLQELVAPFALLAAFGACAFAGVPMQVAHVARGIGRAFLQGLSLVWFWAPIVLVVLHRRGRLANPETDPTRLRVLFPLIRLMLGFGVIAFAYSHLKAVLPRINPVLTDPELLRVDEILGFGRAWNERLGAIRAPWFVALMDWAYLSFFFYFPAAMGTALFRADVEMLEEVIQGFALVFVLGLLGYYLLPSLGTIYTHPEWHQAARGTQSWAVRDALLRQQAAIALGRPARIHAFFGIAAFPSLHVAHALLAFAVLRRRFPRAAWFVVPPFVLMFVATLFFGWHYLVDHLGALVVAWGALRLVRWDHSRRAGSDTSEG